MKVAILGFGREGQSVLRFLKNEPRFKHADIEILDANRAVKTPAGIEKRLGKGYLKNLEQFDVIFRSPGIPYNLPELARARRAGAQMSSATKLFFDEAEKSGAEIVGITGSKGKTTTATLLYKMLKASGKNVFLAGNVGTPALNILPKLTRLTKLGTSKKSIVILELSSFQLQDIESSPHIAVVLDVFPEHQDSHRSLREYYGAKANITRYQKKNDKVFFFAANRLSAWIGKQSRGQKFPFKPDQFNLFAPSDLRMKGAHSFKNAALAAVVAMKLGVPQQTVLRTVKNFRGLKHRLQRIRTIRVNLRSHQRTSAVMFYDDSASHNPHASAAALRSFPHERKVLIAGGKDRPFSYASLAKAVRETDTEAVVLFGENKAKIATAISRIKKKELKIVIVNNLQAAVSTAYKIAISLKPNTKNLKPVCVLLSPGAPSYDMFKNFEERGRMFVKYVRKIKVT